jgi:hypothetical protein
MSLKWVAQRLQMGSWTYVSNLLNNQSNTQSAITTPTQAAAPVLTVNSQDTCHWAARIDSVLASGKGAACFADGGIF